MNEKTHQQKEWYEETKEGEKKVFKTSINMTLHPLGPKVTEVRNPLAPLHSLPLEARPQASLGNIVCDTFCPE